ncbi:Rieske domain-containing protein isoform X1 [Carassius carassius]|uniref:Rieske domain-containing protein isoform X1 n=1 Tax=Carassius carassius TaxID=217509 RepID=UPI00286934E2|nr:Rieske domain-containing protein isoform X1 [Carassius carassius]
MTSPEDESVSWRLIGPVSELSKKQCRLIYSSEGRDADVCLFQVNGEFFVMDARCAHSGGPLCDGDIEEADGVLQVFCPWHDYDFNLKTGKSSTGLQVCCSCAGILHCVNSCQDSGDRRSDLLLFGATEPLDFTSMLPANELSREGLD